MNMSPKKSNRLNVRLSEYELNLFKTYAKANRLTISNFVLGCCLPKYAKHVLGISPKIKRLKG